MSPCESVAVPPEPLDRDRVATWASAHLGVEVIVEALDAPPQTGFDSDIHLLALRGRGLPPEWTRGLVLRVKGSARHLDEARTEAELHDWLADRGYPVPRILAVVEPGVLTDRPVQVIERAAGTTMLDALRRRPWRVRPLLGRFVELHARLHDLDLVDVPIEADVVDRRMRLPRQVAHETGDPALRDAVTLVESWSGRLRDAPPVLCHGDFHPLNLLVDGDRAAVIDWTDAGLGDRHCDVARTAALFDLAPITASSAVERRLLGVAGPWLGRRYLHRHAEARAIDPDRIALWTPVHLLHDWSQALARSGRVRSMPTSMATTLQRRFDLAAAAVG